MARPDWSRPLPRALTIPTVMDLVTLADVRAVIGHLPKEARAKDTWQTVETELKKAATAPHGDTTQVSITLQMVLMLEGVEYKLLR
ncbi:MAG TPA: hypothetical protein VK825_06315 [Xanthobacteraceae bacterium]|nr:hypothetical protein [Xanthobacteraceae bacterium]